MLGIGRERRKTHDSAVPLREGRITFNDERGPGEGGVDGENEKREGSDGWLGEGDVGDPFVRKSTRGGVDDRFDPLNVGMKPFGGEKAMSEERNESSRVGREGFVPNSERWGEDTVG